MFTAKYWSPLVTCAPTRWIPSFCFREGEKTPKTWDLSTSAAPGGVKHKRFGQGSWIPTLQNAVAPWIRTAHVFPISLNPTCSNLTVSHPNPNDRVYLSSCLFHLIYLSISSHLISSHLIYLSILSIDLVSPWVYLTQSKSNPIQSKPLLHTAWVCYSLRSFLLHIPIPRFDGLISANDPVNLSNLDVLRSRQRLPKQKEYS